MNYRLMSRPSAQSARQEEKDLLVGVYRDRGKAEAYGTRINYYSFVGPADCVRSNVVHIRHGDLFLLKSISMPYAWKDDLRRHYSRKAAGFHDHNGCPLAAIGAIGITVTGRRVAETSSYYPKEELPVVRAANRVAPGLGYATEWTALASLRGEADMVSTTFDPSYARTMQLNRVGLRKDAQTPIEEWLAGMLAGLRTSLRKYAAVSRAGARAEGMLERT